MGKRSSRITLVDVANELGVSPATVSLALRDKNVVAKRTRAAVLQKVQELGYVYNRSAAQLRTQRSNSIGLIVPNLLNPFFAELTDQVERVLDAQDSSLIVAGTSEDIEQQAKTLQNMQEYGVDGVLVCPVPRTTPKHLRGLIRSGLPVVLFTRAVRGLAANYVGADNSLGSAIATEYLMSRGHRRLSFIGGLDASTTRTERFSGFVNACKKNGIRVVEEFCLSTETTLQGGYRAISSLIEHPDPPTGAVCYNDVVAFGVILGLWALNRRPGKDFSVVGFDDITNASIWSPPLTTVSSRPQQIGEEAVSLLLSLIEKPRKTPKRVIIPPSLIVRRSCSEPST
jgi:LacI family transcriptional regulator